jgi:hypothetical protein
MDIYAGQVIGEHQRQDDLVVNVIKTKKLTNMRASGSDDKGLHCPGHQVFPGRSPGICGRGRICGSDPLVHPSEKDPFKRKRPETGEESLTVLLNKSLCLLFISPERRD